MKREPKRYRTVENSYPVKETPKIIRLIPMFSPTSSEASRGTEISVRDVTFPELVPSLQCSSNREFEMESFERKVLDCLNVARIRPSFIASILQTRLKEDKIIFKGNEKTGRYKLREAINDLKLSYPLPLLTYSHELSMICREIIGNTDYESLQEDPRAISYNYKRLMAEHGFAEGERSKILYITKTNTPENVVFDLLVNGANGDSQREKVYNPNFKSAGLYAHTINGNTITLLIFYDK